MPRSYWRVIFAFGCLTLASTAASQRAATHGHEIEASSERAADHKKDGTANTIAAGNLADGKKPVQPDCGTAKECRAEQRQKDNLVAQQTAANAAVSQRNAAWWQVGVGAAGVILLILTVLYSQVATKAAVDAVSTLVAVERARIAMNENCITTRDGKTATFALGLRNVGRTVGALKETCIQGSSTGLFADFKPTNVAQFNANIPTETYGLVQTFDFALGDPGYAFVVGYYKFTTLFS